MLVALVGFTLALATAASADSTPPLAVSDARASLAGVLHQKFGGAFAARKHFARSCHRLTTQKVRCRVRWDHGRWHYAGAIDMRTDPDDSSGLLFSSTVKRSRLGDTSPPAERTPAASCDPSYKGACLKPDVSDYDCAGGSGDGPYYVQGPVTVVGDDHYDLDRDGDGVACES